MFAAAGCHEVVIRYAGEPGQIDPDTASRARGLAPKVLDVPGEKLREGGTSQDIQFNTWPVIPQGDAATYLKVIQQRDKHVGNHLLTSAASAVRHRTRWRRSSTGRRTSTRSRSTTTPRARSATATTWRSGNRAGDG